MADPAIGIYEKALPSLPSWPARLDAAAEAGYAFVEIAVDEDRDRLARLCWPAARRRELGQAARSAGAPIHTVILSAHRRYPLGSASPGVRRRATGILDKAVEFAADIGARIVQLAGYFVYYEDRAPQSREWFLEGLGLGLRRASRAGVMLGIETMDGKDITSVERAMEIVRKFDSPWLQVYPDIGNLAANGLDVCEELIRGRGHLVGIHLKDTRPGEFRRVPFGAGVVPFAEAFRTLESIGYDGNFAIEMWNDGEPDAAPIIANARRWTLDRMGEAGFANRR